MVQPSASGACDILEFLPLQYWTRFLCPSSKICSTASKFPAVCFFGLLWLLVVGVFVSFGLGGFRPEMNVLDGMKLFSSWDTALIVGASRLTNINSHMFLIPAVLCLDLGLSGWVISFLVLSLIFAAPMAISCPFSLLDSSCLCDSSPVCFFGYWKVSCCRVFVCVDGRTCGFVVFCSAPRSLLALLSFVACFDGLSACSTVL